MSNVGQAVLTVAGTAVGAFFGQPALGFTLGSIAGNLLFPTKVGAPKIGDTNISTATEGAPLPLLYGTPRQAGIPVDALPIRVVQSSHGAKGGPQTTTNTYYADALYLFGVSPLGPMAGVEKLWLDAKLVYDISAEASADQIAQSAAFADAHMVFYPGDVTDLPDPTLEAHYGVGNVPTYRGMVKIMLRDIDVTSNGARVPQVSAKLVYGTTSSETTLQRRTDVLYAWNDANDPRACKNDHQYRRPGGTWRDHLDDAIADCVAGGDGVTANYTHYITWTTAADRAHAWILGGLSPGETEVLDLHFNAYLPDTSLGVQGFLGTINNTTSPDPGPLWCEPLLYAGVPTNGTTVWWNDTALHDATDGAHIGVWRISYYLPGSTPSYTDAGNFCSECTPDGSGYLPSSLVTHDRIVQCRRKPRGPDAPCTPRCEEPYPLFPGTNEFCVIDGLPESTIGYGKVTGGSNTYVWLSDYFTSGSPATVVCYPLGPAILATDADNNKTYWDAQYAAARAAYPDLIPAGMTYQAGLMAADGLHYPVVKSYDWERVPERISLTPTPITVGDVAGSICALAGLSAGTDFDFADFTQLVTAYNPARIGTARDTLGPLLQYQFGDISDNGSQLVGVVRGGSAVLSLTEDSLAAIEAGQATPPQVTITRTQPAELPRRVRLHFIDASNDYQAGQESAVREYGPERAPTDVELAVAMGPDDAAKVADILLNEAFAGREQYQITLPALDAFLVLKPADPIELPVEGRTRQARIVTIDYAFPALLTLSLVRADAGVYTSTAVGHVVPVGGTQGLPVTGPSNLVVLDLPSLQTGDNDAGVYVATYGDFNGWPGCAIYESKDAGASYVDRASNTQSCAVGTIRAPLPSGSDTVFDYVTTLAVDLQASTLASVTEAAVTGGGANLFAIGAPGRWTIIAAVDCTLQMDGSYLLTGFLQGLRGTLANRGTSIAGDRIVQLDQRLERVPESYSEIGQTRLLRAVTFGTSLTDATDVSFVVTGLSYTAPLAAPTGAPAGSLITSSGTSGDSGAGSGYVAPSAPGNIAVDTGTGFQNVAVHGDAALDADGQLTVTKTNGVSLTSAATTPLDTDNTLSANSDGKIATQKAVKGYVDGKVTGVLRFKGATDCSANPNYPSAALGDAYVVSVAGKIGGASGLSVDVGDVYAASAANAGGTQAAVGSSWFILEHNLVGALLSANNLSDLASVSTARSNLGLGSLAQQNTTLNLALNYAPPVTLASASTVNIGAATSNEIIITGTTPITAFDTIAAGAKREITFSGALILTHNATSLILPGAANITTAAGDVASMLSLGAGNWRCTAFSKANGQAVASTSAFTFLRGADFFNDGLVLVASDADIPVIDVPVNCTITGWRILTQGGPGSCSFDVWKSTYGAYPPVVGGSIVAGNYPAVSSASKATDTTLSGWTTSLTAGDVLAIQLRSSSTLTRCVLLLTLST